MLFAPSAVISSFAGIKFNDTARVDGVVRKYALLMFLLFACISFLLWFKNSYLYKSFSEMLSRLLIRFSGLFTIKTLFVLVFIYITALFAASVYYYDLGFDEAWYITFARNFSEKLFPYYTANERLAVIDTISMLPYYLLSLVNFKFGFTEVWQFKLLSVLVSFFTLIVLYRFACKIYSSAAGIIFIFLLVIQPGFGFIASSYFGEFLQAAFLFLGLYYWQKDHAVKKNIITASLFFAAAIHTKFQLVIIISAVLIILGLSSKESKPFRLLVYTLLFTALVSFIRTIPVLISSPQNLRSLALITDLLAAKSTTVSPSVILERLQLFNRFFPLPVLAAVLGLFAFRMKTAAEKFLFFFTAVTALWWIFLYPLSTYRNPFMAIIVICFMAALMLTELYERYSSKYPAKKINLKYAAGLSIALLMLWGFSANLIYSRIGYNDGVQFDLDGFNSRLFEPVKHDNSQKDFHAELKKTVSPLDTLYNGSFVTRFYLPNTVFTKEKMPESIKSSPAGSTKYFLVTRDVYPLGFKRIYAELDSLAAMDTLKVQLLLKNGEHELYGISKTQK